MNPQISILIPARDEASRVASVVNSLAGSYEVIVVDDASTDSTGEEAEEAGAKILRNPRPQGYVPSLKKGIREATADIVVTMDADGEHDPDDVKRIVEPILSGRADLVLGVRDEIPRPSERLLNRLARLGVDASDTGTGFRAIKADLANNLELDATCTCGTLALEAAAKGAKIDEIPIETGGVDKPRDIAWGHAKQLYHVLRHLLGAFLSNT